MYYNRSGFWRKDIAWQLVLDFQKILLYNLVINDIRNGGLSVHGKAPKWLSHDFQAQFLMSFVINNWGRALIAHSRFGILRIPILNNAL